MEWRLGDERELDLDRVEAACRAVATRHDITIQLRARRGAMTCHFEVAGPALRDWEQSAGADMEELDELWRRVGYDGRHRIGLEVAIDGNAHLVRFDLATGANVLGARAGLALARELAHELG